MAKPLRVLHVVSSMNLGGIQTLLMNLYRNIDREKVQFDFAVHTQEKNVFDDEIKALGGKIYKVPKFKGINIFKYKKFWNEFFDSHYEYNIIHGHIRTTAAIYLKIAKKHGRIAIAHSHSTYIEPGIAGFIKKIMEYPLRYIADYCYACSEEAAKILFGEKRGKETLILRNAIDVKKFQYSSEKRKKFRQEYGIKDTDKVAGTVGRIVEPKNPFFILEIIEECVKKDERFKFLWVGEGNLYGEIVRIAKEKHLDTNIVFTGGINNPEDALDAMDCFILPSIDEGFGIAAVEAQANGLPTILSDTIPKDVIMIKSAATESLNTPAYKWAEKILIMCYENRTVDISAISRLGYDIDQVAKELQKFYISLADGMKR